MFPSIDVLNTEDDKQQFLDNIETWDCMLGKGMNDQGLPVPLVDVPLHVDAEDRRLGKQNNYCFSVFNLFIINLRVINS